MSNLYFSYLAMSSVTLLLTSLARRAATAEEELPYAAQK